MAHPYPHSHRTTALPHPGPQISARDQYTPATPSFRRPSEHAARSPSFAAQPRGRHPLSPTTSPNTVFSTTAPSMGSSGYGSRPAQNNIPPLQGVQMLGSLQYADGTSVKADIHGVIDKGFFLSENEWTCYRRNYFSCICSFSLNPHMPGMAIQYIAPGSSQSVSVYGFAMCISAVVSDNEQHNIELVQHTPKRDKGPIMKPEKVRLGVKPPQTAHHHHMGMFPESVVTNRPVYPDGFSNQPGGQQLPTEHTFERIQFKQATQNNGKRRAAQQYYQLVVELWGDVGTQSGGSDQFVKIATRKSAKMIVRGRSPGHYQNDRRGSQSSGPGGSSGNLGPFVSAVGDFNANPMMSGPSYAAASGFDTRGSVYGVRHHDIPPESMIPSEEAKAIGTTREYQYYPGSMYEAQGERIDLFNPRTDRDGVIPHMATGLDVSGKIKPDYDGATLPSIFHPPPQIGERPPAPFEGKSTSSGYYPTSMVPSSGINMTMT
ncbi:Transcription factor vib-1 [Fusarium albosuccineum]|uniref:Transcription factor vib-1 n=1 Tax=Fusarium albosuccineum TaxID=1237068 RepID=A0A8H4L2T9_9HYPO|nr:Transcription factor vib-1 [Fusarium albosuccineum]